MPTPHKKRIRIAVALSAGLILAGAAPAMAGGGIASGLPLVGPLLDDTVGGLLGGLLGGDSAGVGGLAPLEVVEELPLVGPVVGGTLSSLLGGSVGSLGGGLPLIGSLLGGRGGDDILGGLAGFL